MSEQIALNIDCMEYMKTIPDKYFDLAVVDPPYGGGAKLDDNRSQIGNVERERELHGGGADWESKQRSRFGGWFDRYHISGENGRQVGNEVSSGRCL